MCSNNFLKLIALWINVQYLKIISLLLLKTDEEIELLFNFIKCIIFIFGVYNHKKKYFFILHFNPDYGLGYKSVLLFFYLLKISFVIRFL